jgi:hypothetical protein
MADVISIPLSEVAGRMPRHADIFICSASFETRSTSIAMSLRHDQFGKVLVCANKEFMQEIGENETRLLAHFGDKAERVVLSHDDPFMGLDSIRMALTAAHLGEKANVVVDITTFTHEGFLILVKLLTVTLRPGHRLQFVYTPASEYAIGLPSEQKWLSRGLKEIRSVLGFPGAMLPGRSLHLIVLVGFEVERARLLIDSLEPDAISLGVGYDSTDGKGKHLPKNMESLNQLSIHYPSVRHFSFSSVNPNETEESLKVQVALLPAMNAVIAPMNTKMSTLGAALLALRDRRLQLCYAPALTYNTPAYSHPADFCFVTDVALPLASEMPLP